MIFYAQQRGLVVLQSHTTDFVGASFEISYLRQPMTFTRRSFRNMDPSALLAAAAYLPWDSIGSFFDANLKLLRLNSLMVALLDRFGRTWAHIL
jgi:hypothetical protein